MEIWKDVVGYEGLYEVSNYGNVRSLNYNHTGMSKLLTPQLSNCGYLRVQFNVNGKRLKKSIHRLVAEAFIPNPGGLLFVNHINEDKTDNRVENLEWCTAKYNRNYGTTETRRITSYINNNKRGKAVIQLSPKGDFIKEWKSVGEIERVLGFLQGNISNCCRGLTQTSHKYIWKYKSPSVS